METLRHLERIEVRGTSAERLAIKTTDLPTDKLYFFYESDTKNKWLWIGDWLQLESAGAALVAEKGTEQSVIDNTGVYLYTGYAAFGIPTSAAGWQIFRQEITAGGLGPKLRANGNSNYANVWDNRATTVSFS